MKHSIYASIACLFLVACGGSSSTDTTTDTPQTKEALGELLFNDTSLSLTRNMSCATCHNPEQAFVDTRTNSVGKAVSVGDDGSSLGDRNSPTIGYANFTPDFDLDDLSGGQFLDGRASNLTEQAKGPFLNAVEMQMPDEASVIARVQENDSYVSSMQSLYGATVFDDTDTAYTAIADAIAAFENTNVFFPFDSDFDTNTMSAAAIRGRVLFRSNAINCVRCHDDRPQNNTLFTNFEYENLGIPINSAVRAINGHTTDLGLSEHPDVNDGRQDGRFKVSTLRNIAVTGPYMHNGVFQNLKTVVHFYNTRDVNGSINPETGLAWEAPEVNRANIVTNDVGDLGLSDAEEDDIVAFLEALTDAKYESLIP
ncbi:MAG: methylamine utilization protein MauG [Epsilonproteobacteria bacterium]|nr:MAG: methylamine utilization protein MauG [Campylobacterota bacterium]